MYIIFYIIECIAYFNPFGHKIESIYKHLRYVQTDIQVLEIFCLE